MTQRISSANRVGHCRLSRLGEVVLIPQRAEAGGAQKKVFTGRGRQRQPNRGKNAHEVAARKEKDISRNRAHEPDHAVRPPGHLFRRLASRAAVAKQFPARALHEDFG